MPKMASIMFTFKDSNKPAKTFTNVEVDYGPTVYTVWSFLDESQPVTDIPLDTIDFVTYVEYVDPPTPPYKTDPG